jgi:hypothetical protein
VATVALGVVGAVAGAATGIPGGAQLGFAVGTILGSLLEASKARPQSVGRLQDLHLTGSQYGTTIPWVYGRQRLGGTVVWWSDLIETSRKKGSKLAGTRTKVYTYSVDLAVLVCRGPITAFKKIWANDTIIYDADNGLTPAWIHPYLGDYTQVPDGVIVAALPAGTAPAYRGRAYVVFDNMPLAEYGNQVPNFSFLVENTLTYPEVVMGDGPLAYYQLDTVPGLTADTSGSGYTLTVSTGTVTPIAGRYGQAASVTSGLAELTSTVGPVAALASPRMSVEGWFQYKGGSPTGNGATRIKFYNSGVGFQAWEMVVQPNVILNEINLQWIVDTTAFGSYTTIHNYSFTRDTLWHQVIVTYDGTGNSILYLDGVAVDTQPAVGNVSIGLNASDQIWLRVTDNIRLDEVSIYDHLLSAAQVAEHFTPPATVPLKTVLADVFRQVGLAGSDYDVQQATDVVRGLLLPDRTEARAFIDGPCRFFFNDLIEGDGKIKAVKRGGSIAMLIEAEDMGAELTEGSDLEPKAVLDISRTQELELPFSVAVLYNDTGKEYQQGEQHDQRYSKPHLTEQLTFAMNLALTADEARQGALRLLYTAWLEREKFECSLLPKYLGLLPADPVSVPVPGATARLRIDQMDLALPGPIRLTLVPDEPSVLTQATSGGAPLANPLATGAVIATTLVAWNGNAGRDADADTIGLYLAGNGSSAGFWSGAVVYWASASAGSYQELETVEDPATLGTASTVLAAFTSTGPFDNTNTVDILLTAGTDNPPVTVSDDDLFAGVNGVVIGDEYLQYGTVTSLGGNAYRLAHLLRGRRGTDTFWEEHITGERVVFDNGGIKRVALPSGVGAGQIFLKAVGNGQQLADVSPLTVNVFGRELLAWSPVQVAGSRDGSNNLTVSFQRRARKNNGLLPGQEAPLDYLLERYTLLILPVAGTTVTALTRQPQAVVTAAGHGLVAGDLAYFSGIGGMLGINGMAATVLSVSGTSFTVDLDSTGFAPYVSGGAVRKPLRSIAGTTNSIPYSAANQTTDFGSPQPSISIALYQLNDAGTRGYPAVATV